MQEKRFKLVFDEVMKDQLKKLAKDKNIRSIISNFFDNMEYLGPDAGKLLDSKLFIYEMKNKHPPIRLYFKHVKETNEIYIFEYEMKSSEKKQEKTVQKIKFKTLGKFKR